jgi:predicted dehydrogenase
MEHLKLALVGCGGMGTRHLYGLRELAQTPFNQVELAALCDIRQENAEMAASEAEKLFGYRPAVYTDLEVMARRMPGLDAVSIVTDPSVHHAVACQALDLGWHVMVEKPMAITVGACRRMLDAAARNRRLLSVAENYRRDPSARLIHHILHTQRLGRPYLAWLHALSGGNSIFITPWRHLKDKGGPLLDMGVHYTDLIRYQLGDIAEVYGDVRLVEKERVKPEAIGDPYAFYQARHRAMPDRVPATAEDVSIALLRMESGVMVNWIMGCAGTGGVSGEMILCAEGRIETYGGRGGRAVLQRRGEALRQHEGVLELAPDFALEPLAAHFFPDRVTAGNADWRLIALEYHELAEAVLNGRPVEVDGMEGLKDVAAVYAIFESALAGRAVGMEEVESGRLYAYQREIDAALGIG